MIYLKCMKENSKNELGQEPLHVGEIREGPVNRVNAEALTFYTSDHGSDLNIVGPQPKECKV
jgi:hypothetical protein